jgi:flagellar hook-length control protein FliK
VLNQIVKTLGTSGSARQADAQFASQEPGLDAFQVAQDPATDPTTIAATVAAMAAAALAVTVVASGGSTDKATPAVSAVPIAPIVPADLTQPAKSNLSALAGQVLTATVLARTPTGRAQEAKSADDNSGRSSLAFDPSGSEAPYGSPVTQAAPLSVAVNAESKTIIGNPANPLLAIKTPDTPAIVAAPASASAVLAAQGTSSIDQSASFESILAQTQGGNVVSAETAAAQASASASVHAENTTKLAAATSNGAPALVVNTPLGNTGWTSEVGDKVMWMLGRQEQRVELVLNPPQLGRVEVSLSLNGDQATAQFLSANPVVREALENAMPRLREMLADGGITLGQTHVGSDSSGQAANQRENGDNRPGFGSGNTMLELPIRAGGAANQWLERGRGLVDVFA